MRAHTLSGLLLSISVLTLAACSGGQSQGIGSSKSAAPLPPESITQTGLTEGDTLTPVSMTTEPVVTTSTSLSTPPAPMTATVATGAPVEDRIAKLEDTVNSLRRDYDRIMPAFASLNTTNERIQTLLDEIEQQPLGNVAKAQPQAIAPTSVQKTVETTTEVVAPSEDVLAAMDKMAAPAGTVVETATATTTTTIAANVPAASAPAVTPIAITETVKGVRIGEHGAKTRVVIDLGGNMRPDATFDLDNNEKLLLVDLPGTAWVGGTSGAPKNSAFVSGWSVQDGASGGSALAIQLKKGAKITSTEYLKASGKDGARLVIDLGPSV